MLVGEIHDHLGDPLEAGQGHLAFHPIGLCHGFHHGGGNDGGGHEFVSAEAFPFVFIQQKARHQHHGLVAVEQFEPAFGVSHRYAQAVAVGVGAHHHVGADGFAPFQGHGQGGRLFRVRGGHGRETPVRGGLLLDDGHLCVPGPPQHFRDGGDGSAVQGGKDNGEIFPAPGPNAAIFYGGPDKGLVDFPVDQLDQRRVGLKTDIAVIEAVDLFDDLPVLGGRDLPAVGPVHLVAVVLRGVV